MATTVRLLRTRSRYRSPVAPPNDATVGASASRTSAPLPAHGGKSVQDFEPPSNISAIRDALGLLPTTQRRRLIFATLAQISLSVLDLLGILLIGLVASIAAWQVASSGELPSTVNDIVLRLGLEDQSVTRLSIGLAVLAVAILVSKTLLQSVLTRFLFRFLANQQATVSADLARRFLSQPLMFVQQWTTSEATYALGMGVGAATVALLGATITIIAEVSLFVIVLFTLFLLDPWVTLASIVIFGFAAFGTYRLLSTRTARNTQRVTEGSIGTLSAISQALHTYRETFILHRRSFYAERYSEIVGSMAKASASNAFLMEAPKFILESVLYISILLLGLTQFLINDSFVAAAGTIAIFLAAGTRLVPAVLRLQGATITARNAAVASQPTFYMVRELDGRDLERTDELSLRPEAELRTFVPELSVEDVTYTYPGETSPALKAISFHAPPGTSIALVGSTGAGKSTLADLILGVLDPDEGRVSLSGIEPKKAVARWPGSIGYVPQAVALIPGNVRENVALGLPPESVDDQAVWEALERARIADFLRSARQGLDTSIGERGIRLSGGQRQRLGIARALFSKPKILVLDEATSALDADTEFAIVETLNDLEGDVTTVTIAHRLATVRTVDQVLYLQQGVIRGSGTFDELRSSVPDFDRQASLSGL